MSEHGSFSSTLTAGHIDDITASLANVLDPAVFVIGGGVRAAGELLREPAVFAFENNLTGWRRCAIPDVQLARFGPEAGIIGAADLARHRSRTRRRR